ncbi:MAG: apolipoprotein N-acyltransferase [Planctomycetota bacterium]|nr:apolipoprotein N-acyltransferase [Planctomycetota bacterium]
MPAVLLTALTLIMCCLIFPPANWWPLAFICLVPWLVTVATMMRARFVYFVSYLLGLGYFLVNLHWMGPVTVPGYLAMCAYFAVFFPLAAWPIRHMYRRRNVSLALIVPVVWVATEYLRSITPLGFPFVLLAHSQYKILMMIQISDLTGAYGVSFVLAMVNGCLTDLLIQPIALWRAERPEGATRLPIGTLTTGLILLGTLIYGAAQKSNKYFMDGGGPTVAVVQADFPMYVDQRGRTSPRVILDTYFELARQAAESKPDLVLLPETAWSAYINDEFINASPEELEEIRARRFGPSWQPHNIAELQRFSREARDRIQRLSTETGVSILVGSSSLESKPQGIPPDRVDAFNSAFLIKPGRDRPAARYDKIHLVLFGEYVPFRYTSMHSLYKWLNSQTPWGKSGTEYSLTAGTEFRVFELEAASEGGRVFRAGVPICYEEVMPYIPRTFVIGDDDSRDRKNIDILLSISNDGWFHHLAELEQHLSTAVFRAVENRIPVARSVNTGASALLDPNGHIRHRVWMSDEKIERLGPVTSALGELRDLTERIEQDIEKGRSYQSNLQMFNKVNTNNLRPALTAVGAEFAFMWAKLRDQVRMAGLPYKGQEEPATWARVLAVKVEDSIAQVERWRTTPWTAPGFKIAELRMDDRMTVYSRLGDRFSQVALVLTLIMILDWIIRRLRSRPAAEPVQEADKDDH